VLILNLLNGPRPRAVVLRTGAYSTKARFEWSRCAKPDPPLARCWRSWGRGTVPSSGVLALVSPEHAVVRRTPVKVYGGRRHYDARVCARILPARRHPLSKDPNGSRYDLRRRRVPAYPLLAEL